MDAEKIKRLEEAGWKIGSAYEFLKLNRQEAEYIGLKLKRAASDKARVGQGRTQV